MTKQQLIERLASDNRISRAAAADYLNSLVDIIHEETKVNGKFTLHNLATFVTKVRPARTYKDPRNGNAVPVPEKTVVAVKAHGKFKNLV